MTQIPEELRELEHRLRQVRFRPRESLEPELLGRVRRRDAPATASPTWARRHLAILAVAIVAGSSAIGIVSIPTEALLTIDRCCYDLDGGGSADDGVEVVAERNSKVQRLRVYEDLDGSASLTPGDMVRLDRGEKPAFVESDIEGLITRRRCCVDLDGGGPDDDGLLVIGSPPDRVFMAAIYETGSSEGWGSRTNGWRLR